MFTSFIKFLFSLSLLANALLFIPQIVKLYRTKDTSGVSLLMFLGFNVTQLIAVVYGYVRGDFILMYGFLLTLFTCGTVSILILIYRTKRDKI